MDNSDLIARLGELQRDLEPLIGRAVECDRKTEFINSRIREREALERSWMSLSPEGSERDVRAEVVRKWEAIRPEVEELCKEPISVSADVRRFCRNLRDLLDDALDQVPAGPATKLCRKILRLPLMGPASKPSPLPIVGLSAQDLPKIRRLCAELGEILATPDVAVTPAAQGTPQAPNDTPPEPHATTPIQGGEVEPPGPAARKKRGRPTEIPIKRKEAALKVIADGGTNKDAAILMYDTPYPKRQQIKNVPNNLRALRKSKAGPAEG